MTHRILAPTLLALACALAPCTGHAAAPVSGVDYAALVEQNRASVVLVHVKGIKKSVAPEEKGAEPEAAGQGSGFVLDAARGLVLTNAHVVKGATDITVVLSDKRRLVAKLVGAD